jgi:hypothetical protein
MSPIDQSGLVRLFRSVRNFFAAARQPRAPLLTFSMVAPSVRDGWIGRFGQWLWRRTLTAATASRAAAALSGAIGRLQSFDLALRIALGAAVIAIAALTNLVMLTVVERYHFPRRTTLVLPVVIAVAALAVVAMKGEVARAAEDKRHK